MNGDTGTPEWIKPGVKVAEVSYGSSRRESVTLATVERTTKTQVILDNGNRYRLDRLHRSTGTWSPTVYLKLAADPKVLSALRLQSTASTAAKIQLLADRLRQHPEETGHLGQIVSLAQRMLDQLPEAAS